MEKKKIIIKRKKQQQHKNNNKQITIKRSYIQTRDPPTKIFSLLKKTLSRYQTGISLHSLKFTTTPKRNIIQLKSDIQSFFPMHQKIIIHKIFLKRNPISHHLEIEIGIQIHQIDILNNSDLEGMYICSKNNLS